MTESARVPCQNCGESIWEETTKCPFCGDQKLTRDRYLAYMLLFVPMVAGAAALVLSLVIAVAVLAVAPTSPLADPQATVWWGAGLFVIFYAVGAYLTRQQRRAYLDYLQEAVKRAAQVDAEADTDTDTDAVE